MQELDTLHGLETCLIRIIFIQEQNEIELKVELVHNIIIIVVNKPHWPSLFQRAEIKINTFEMSASVLY